MKILQTCIVLWLSVFLFSCKEEGRIDHLNSNLSAPMQISDIKAEPEPGKVLISYQLPDDPNLSYVKAVYEIRPNVYREVKSSYYTDTLRLVGFGDTLDHQVKLYSVGRNEKTSNPMSISVASLTPPVFSIYDSLTLETTFGGVKVGFKNASQAKIAIRVIMDTTGNGDWEELTTFHSGALQGKFTVRGLSSKLRYFGVFIRDRWNNKSDTLIKQLTPYFEELIPKNSWKVVKLPGDTWEKQGNHNYDIENLWNGVINSPGSHYSGVAFVSKKPAPLPSWFTIDLGKKVSMSRIIEHQTYPASHFYGGSAVKAFEIWGSNNPDQDGGWAHWDSLGTFHSFKPSGLPMGQYTDEDKQYGWFKGENFEFDNTPLPGYRYIRWKTLETYSSPTNQVVIAELDVYGRIVQ